MCEGRKSVESAAARGNRVRHQSAPIKQIPNFDNSAPIQPCPVASRSLPSLSRFRMMKHRVAGGGEEEERRMEDVASTA